jgi:hypothetical protein
VTATVTTVDEATESFRWTAHCTYSDQVWHHRWSFNPGTYRERLQVQPLASHRSRLGAVLPGSTRLYVTSCTRRPTRRWWDLTERADHLQSPPDRIGNVLDLERAIRNQAVSHMDVERDRDGSAVSVCSQNERCPGCSQRPSCPHACGGSDWRHIPSLAAVIAREQEPLLRNVAARKVSVGSDGLDGHETV